MDATDEVIGIMDRKQRDMSRRIRELEAELQVRDNSANEVLRILREATGKRDFHSEMEAAQWAAKMLAEARKDAERYHHIRTGSLIHWEPGKIHNRISWPTIFGAEPVDGGNYRDRFDAAIDAAIKGAK